MAKKGWIFGHFCPSLPAYKLPLDPIFALIDKNIINGCCHNKSTDRELLQTVTSQSSCHFLENLIFGHFWQFTSISACLHKIPWPPPLLLLTNLLSFGAIAMLPAEKKQLQAIITPFLHCFLFCLVNFGHLWPLLPVIACFLMAPWHPPHFCFYWQKCWHWVLLKYFLWKKKAITIPLSCHFLENLIFSHLWPFTPIWACFWATPWPRL